MTIYDIEKLNDNVHIQKKTPNPQIYTLYEMGAELEESVGGIGGDLDTLEETVEGIGNDLDTLEGVVEGIIGAVGTVGTDTQPVKLVDGVCTPVTNPLVDTATDQNVDGIKTFLDNPKGANAASGAVDTSLINANWASQTGNDAPNNFIHKTGNEHKDGILKMSSFISYGNTIVDITTEDSNKWIKVIVTQENVNYNDHGLLFYLLPRHVNEGIQQYNLNIRVKNKDIYLKSVIGGFNSKYKFAIRRVIREDANPLVEVYIKSSELHYTLVPIIAYHMGDVANEYIKQLTIDQTSFPGFFFYIGCIVTDLTDADMTYIYDTQ